MSTYTRRTFDVEAVQLKHLTALADGQTGEPGDWLVTYPNGTQKIMSDRDFRAEFVQKPEPRPERDPIAPWGPFFHKRYRLGLHESI